MTQSNLLLLYALAAVIALILLIARFKWHPFVALIVVSLSMGLVAGMPPSAAVKSFQDGVGTTLGFIAVVVALGTMLGKMMAESGAATRIATTLIEVFGESRVHWALMIVAFIVGAPRRVRTLIPFRLYCRIVLFVIATVSVPAPCSVAEMPFV